MSGTSVLYNGVTLKEVQTEQFDQEVVYDDSGTDVIHHRFLVRVSGSVHANQALGHGVITPTASATAVGVMQQVHSLLSHPRATFIYTVNGVVLLQATDDTDVNNGPKPQVVSITQVVAQKLFRVVFAIEVCLVYCQGESRTGPTYGAPKAKNVLNNRWRVREEKDSRWHTTRTIEGVLKVSRPEAWPHSFRNMVCPKLPKGYRRERMTFVDSADGLSLEYTVVDRQEDAAPPPPAIDWDCKYTESGGMMARTHFGDMQITLRGNPGTDKLELLKGAFAVMYQRLDGLRTGTVGAERSWLRQIAIAEDLAKNEVTLSVKVQHVSVEDKVLGIRMAKIGQPLDIDDYDSKKWPVPKPYDGSSPSGLWYKYMQSPCNDIHGLPKPGKITKQGQEPEGDEDDQGVAEFLEATEDLELDGNENWASQEHEEAPYTYYEIEARYENENGLTALPIARISGYPTPSVAIFKMHQTVSKCIVVVHGERLDAWPQFPPPRTYVVDPNGVRMRLLKHTFLPLHPELIPDQATFLYKGQVKYEYVYEYELPAAGKLMVGSDPSDSSSPSDHVLDIAQVFDFNASIFT
jgi:hypothetical protein